MANNESKVLTTNSFEDWRRASNEVSYHLGDIDQFDARVGDKVYTYSASADQGLFIGADSGSKILRFELVSEVPIDVTSTIIFDIASPPTIASNWVAGKTVYQGSVGSETFTGVILYVNETKVALTSTTGTFSASTDLTQTTDSTHQTIANADLIRSFSESYSNSYAKVYNAATEQAQSTAQVGFHVPNLAFTIVLNGTPAVLASFTEGATVYQGSNYASATFTGTILNTTTSNVYLKTYTGTFSASSMLKELSDSGSDRIIAARITSGAVVDTSFGTIIELHTLASASDAIKLVSTGAVDAIKELQDDIGTVENLTTSAGDVVLAINEVEAVFDASTYEISAAANAFDVTSGEFTLDSSGDIILDADGGDIILKDAGTIVGTLSLDTSDLAIRSRVSDKDIIFKGSDGGSEITALTLDMSDLGAATFTNDVNVGVNLDVSGTGTIDGNLAVGADKFNVIASSGNTQIDGTLDVDGNFEVGVAKFNVTAATGNTQIDGTLDVDGTGTIDGNFAVGADKFNVTAATGNTQIDGTLEVDGTLGVDGNSALVGTLTVTGATVLNGGLTMDTNKFTVANTSGNTAIAGTLGVTGVVDIGQLSATFANRNNVKLALNELMTDLGDVTASNMGTTASTVVTAMAEVHTDVDARLIKNTTSSQTITGPIIYGDGTNSRTLTFANNTILDVSNGTLLVSAAGNIANFGSAFLNLDATEASGSNVTLQGLQVDRSSISGGAATHDVRLQWDESRVAADPEEAWELQGLSTNGADSNSSSILTRYNAFNLIANNTETGIAVNWDSTNENFDFILDNSVFALTGDVTGSVTQTAKGNVSIATTIAANSVALGTDTTGNYVATIAGTANEITVAGSGSETAGVTISLPDDVTIGDDLTVTDALSVGGNTILTGNLNVNGNTTLGNATSDTVSTTGNLTVAGNLTVSGDTTTLNVATLEVEDTIILAGSNLGSTEPTSGGFGFETKVFAGVHSNAAAGVTGAHSLVYNFATDQWEGDGSLVLTSATLGVAKIENTDFDTGKDLVFSAGGGMTEAVSGLGGNTFTVTYTNADRGSSQLFYKTFTTDSGSAVASANNDTLTIAGGTALASARSGDTITLNHSNVGVGAATYGQTGTEDGKYIKSVIVNAQGHVTAVTSDDFDDRYAGPHPTHPGDDISLDTGALSGATIISDIDFNITTDTSGHVTDATLTTLNTRELNLHDLADTDWGFGGSEPADAAIGIYDQTSNTWRDYVLSGDVTMNDVGACVVANNSHTHTYSNISSGAPIVGNGGLTQINFTSAFNTKLAGIETSATADQSNAEIRAAVAAATDSQVFTDGDHTKLNGIATSATNTAVPYYTSAIAVGDGGLTTNNFTNDDHTKLNGIATSANNYSFPLTIASANTASAVVQRDGSGNFIAGTITATLTGQASTIASQATSATTDTTNASNISSGTLAAARVATLNQNTTGSSGSTTGNAATVTVTSQQGNTSYNVLYHSGTTIYDDGANNFSYNGSTNNLNVANYIYCTDVIASSDERLKDIIEPITGALDKVCAIDGFIFKWNDKAPSKDTVTRQVGVSAQQIQKVLPEVVEENEAGYLGVAYDKLIPLLIESIKELKAEVEELKIINSNEGKS